MEVLGSTLGQRRRRDLRPGAPPESTFVLRQGVPPPLALSVQAGLYSGANSFSVEYCDSSCPACLENSPKVEDCPSEVAGRALVRDLLALYWMRRLVSDRHIALRCESNSSTYHAMSVDTRESAATLIGNPAGLVRHPNENLGSARDGGHHSHSRRTFCPANHEEKLSFVH